MRAINGKDDTEGRAAEKREHTIHHNQGRSFYRGQRWLTNLGLARNKSHVHDERKNIGRTKKKRDQKPHRKTDFFGPGRKQALVGGLDELSSKKG